MFFMENEPRIPEETLQQEGVVPEDGEDQSRKPIKAGEFGNVEIFRMPSRRREVPLVSVPTEMMGIYTVWEKGITPEEAKAFPHAKKSNLLGRKRRRRKNLINRLTREERSENREQVAFADKFPGYRGVASRRADLYTHIYPDSKVSIQYLLLLQSLGDNFAKYTHTDIVASIDAQAFANRRGALRAEGVLAALHRRFPKMSIEDIKRAVNVRTVITVDEEALLRDIDAGRISLIDGTIKTKVSGRKVVQYPFSAAPKPLYPQQRKEKDNS